MRISSIIETVGGTPLPSSIEANLPTAESAADVSQDSVTEKETVVPFCPSPKPIY